MEKNNWLHLVRIKKDDSGLPFYDRNKDSEIVFKKRKIFEELYSKRIERVNRFYNQIGFNNLVYKCKGSDTCDFKSITNPKELFNGVKSVKIALIDDSYIESNLGNIKKG